MEKQEKEKSLIRKIVPKQESQEGIHFDPENFLEDINFYKVSREIEKESKIFASEKEALKLIKEGISNALDPEDPLIQKYEEEGPFGFKELKKKYNEELRSIGLDLEEIVTYGPEENVMDEVTMLQEVGEEENVLEENSTTEDKEKRKEIIYIQDYKKFIDFLKQLDIEKMSSAQVNFLDTILDYLTDGIAEYYDTRKSDERLEELLLASKDIINEYKRLDRNQKARLFPQLREFEDHILAARGEYLREFNFLTENMNTIPPLEKIWDREFDKDLYIKTLDNVYKRISRIQKNENALKNRNSMYLIRDYEEKFLRDLEFVHSLLVKNPKEDEDMERILALLVGTPKDKVLKEVTEHLEDFLKKIR